MSTNAQSGCRRGEK